jgi:pyruvate dehydrogenase E2 component (dihydrolipoamide acetyltransferase)
MEGLLQSSTPQEIAIMGVGRIIVKPIVINGDLVTASMPLSPTSDHLIMDGLPAAKFPRSLEKFLENPDLLLAHKRAQNP